MLINAAMLLERAAHLVAEPHQRSEPRDGHANAIEPRPLRTAPGKTPARRLPALVGSVPFRTSLLETSPSIDRALKATIEEISLRRLYSPRHQGPRGTLRTGHNFHHASGLTAKLDGEFDNWANRLLPEIAIRILDATYLKVRLGGSVSDCAIPGTIGIRRCDGKPAVLGISCTLSEAEAHWRAFLISREEVATIAPTPSTPPTSSPPTPTSSSAPP